MNESIHELSVEHATVSDLYRLSSGTRARSHGFDSLHNVHPRRHLAKHDMLTIQMRGGHSGNEELTTVAVGTRVGHGQESGLVML